MKENKVISDIEQLTPERLTSILKNNGYLSHGKVAKIIQRNPIEKIASDVHFLRLNFSNDTQTELISPEIVVKISKPK